MSQQVINIGAAPNDGAGDALRVSFDKSNQNFTELYKGAGGVAQGLWNFNATDTNTSTAPVSGRFKTNSGNYRTATQVAIHGTTIQGIDRSNSLRTLLKNDIIQCQDSTNSVAWCRYTLQSAPVDNGSWFQINVALETDGGVASGDNQEIVFVFTANKSGAPGGTTQYRFDTATAPPPTSGNIRCNNASMSATTTLYVHNITDPGADIKQVLNALATGTALVIQDQGNSVNYAKFAVSGAPVDQTTYTQIPVTYTASAGTIANNARILFAMLGGASGGAGGNVSNSGTPTAGQVAQWTDATHIQGVAASTIGAWVLLSRQVASAVANLSFTGINSTYDQYVFVLSEILPATASGSFCARISEDNGSTYKSGASDYRWSFAYVTDGGGTASTAPLGSAGSPNIQISGTTGNGAGRMLNGMLYFGVPGGSSTFKQLRIVELSWWDNTTPILYHITGGTAAYQADSNPINAIRFFFSNSSNFTGSIAMYGIRKS